MQIIIQHTFGSDGPVVEVQIKEKKTCFKLKNN